MNQVSRIQPISDAEAARLASPECIAELAERISSTPVHRSARRGVAGRRRPFVLTGAALGFAAAAAIALTLAFSATTSPPAFAVTKAPGGLVTVTVRQVAAVSGLNARFKELGIRARAVPVVAGCKATNLRIRLFEVERFLLKARRGKRQLVEREGAVPVAVTTLMFNAAGVPPHHTFVLAAKQIAPGRVELAGWTVPGRAPACVGQGR
jgi:hypothetical protein